LYVQNRTLWAIVVVVIGLANVGNSPYSILVFIVTTVLLAIDFYYLKNIAGRRLVGLRWWNEVDPQSGDSHWVFESADPETRTINPTDKRFFWLALYAQPALWIVMGAVAILKLLSFVALTPLWLTLVGEYIAEGLPVTVAVVANVFQVIALILTVTNTIAFSRCDKFSHASNMASSALNTGGLARTVANGMLSRFFGR
jgi:hypothetical protein